MRMRLAGSTFENVHVPLLWGSRAIIAHSRGELSVVDLSDSEARPEILANKAAPGIEYSDREDGIVIYKEGDAVYFFSVARRLIRDVTGKLPECRFQENEILVGTNTFRGIDVRGFGVGIGVSENGMFIGGPIPASLAALKV